MIGNNGGSKIMSIKKTRKKKQSKFNMYNYKIGINENIYEQLGRINLHQIDFVPS